MGGRLASATAASGRRVTLHQAPDVASGKARVCFGATALAVLVGLAIQVPVAANATMGFFDTPLARALNVFAFFTVLSNLIVAVTCGLLAVGRGRPSTVFDTARLIGVVAITITGIVYHSVLSDLCSTWSAGPWWPTTSCTRSCR
jgi:hypothetical protein